MATDLDYYELTPDEAMQKLRSSRSGLSSRESKSRQQKYGHNKLVEFKKRTALIMFFGQFKSWLIAILIVAALISAAIRFWVDASVIISIVIINAILGFIQEYRSEKAVDALKALSAPKATVLRDGKPAVISAFELVPGDIVFLATGDKVPADVRLLEVVNFRVSESLLTGESVPVNKSVSTINKKSPVVDRKNCAFMDTIVVNGHAVGVVFGTGMSSEVGKIAALLGKVEEKATPLEKGIAEIGKKLAWGVVAICIVMFGVGFFKGAEPLLLSLSAISLGVSAVPEGLPAVVTIALALGAKRLAKSKAIVRKLHSVETLGSCSFICCDKTGTLTKNEMAVTKVYVNGKTVDVAGSGYEPKGKFTHNNLDFAVKDSHMLMALKIGALCNSATLHKDSGSWGIIGDPTEGALIVLAEKAGLPKQALLNLYPPVSEISFDSARKRMSTIHRGPHGYWVFTKGAPDVLLKHCTHIFEGGKIAKLTDAKKAELLKVNNELASSALRVLGLAFNEIKEFDPKRVHHEIIEKNLVFVGLVGMIDPPRPEVKHALKLCESAGIRVSIITGDHRNTAVAIGSELGLIKPDSRIIDGDELDSMPPELLELVCENVAIYARASPEHKTRIVEALQKRGHVIAMTGDGANDAPALKDADIGIAMGTGTDVAKEASAMILEDDNFATIVNAIREGRGIYDNIKKFVRFMITSNASEVMTVFFATMVSLPLPLLAVQILWINLLGDGLPAVALAVDPVDKGVMKSGPRSTKEKVIDGQMLSTIAVIVTVITAGSLLIFWHELGAGADLSRARAMVFTGIIVTEMFVVFATRSPTDSFTKGFFSNPWLLAAVASSLGMQALILYVPFLQTLFGVEALALKDWVLLGAFGLSVVIAEEARKFLFKLKPRKPAF
ncbi:MAG: calcium-translocating P-type ATPase, SERCA-type [archaeon]